MSIDRPSKERVSPRHRPSASNRETVVVVFAFTAILIAWAVFAAVLVLRLGR